MNADAKEGDAHVVIVEPGHGEPIDLGPIRMRILEDGSTTAHRLGLALIRIPPHTAGPPTHWHARHDETFYVVEGTAHFVTANGEREALTGTLVTVPPGAVHTFANPGDEECVLLNTFTPDLYVEYFRDLAAAQSVGEPLSGHRILEIMSRYSSYPAKARNQEPG